MAQTNLKTSTCAYLQSAQPLEWILAKDQYFNSFSIGTVGINAASNYVRPDVVNIDSYLSGRDDILTKCNPPIPAMDDVNETPLTYQNQENTNNLQPMYSREKRSAINLDSVTYIPLTFSPELFNPPQDLNHIIFQGQAQRGGLDTTNLVKHSWNSENCESFIDPQRACGKDCSEVNGYMVRQPYSKNNPEAKWGKLPPSITKMSQSSWLSPGVTGTQIGKAFMPERVTTQEVVTAGAAAMGPQQVVPTKQVYRGHDNDVASHNKIPQRSNPYNPPPHLRNPFTGKYYYRNVFDPLVAQ